ncbi:MAG: 4-hydroxy-tetrahydrodipicolinate reductase [Pseudomonadota bacterium]
MTEHINIAVAGCGGRMGKQLVRSALEQGLFVSGGTEAPGSSLIGSDIGRLIGQDPIEVAISDHVSAAATDCDVWIDFTVPEATLQALSELPARGVKAAVIGTTGFDPAQETAIQAAAAKMAIVKAGNFSLGVNLLEALVRQAAARLGHDWDIEILETHHRHKVDAPSGTALMLGAAAAEGRGHALSEQARAPYDGPDARREAGEIAFAVRRMGDVVGDHEVSFGSNLEIISLRHTALNRSVFAHGAIKAAAWAVRQAPGYYNMSDVLGV